MGKDREDDEISLSNDKVKKGAKDLGEKKRRVYVLKRLDIRPLIRISMEMKLGRGAEER